MNKLIAIAIIAAALPVCAMEPTLESQKRESSLMMDGMKSLNSSVSATWVSKETTQSVTKQSAATLKDAKTEVSPAVASAKAALNAQKGTLDTAVPQIAASPEHKKNTGWKIAGGAVGVVVGGLAGLCAIFVAIMAHAS